MISENIIPKTYKMNRLDKTIQNIGETKPKGIVIDNNVFH